MSDSKIDPEKLRKAQETKRIIDLQAFELELQMMSAKARQGKGFQKQYGKGGLF